MKKLSVYKPTGKRIVLAILFAAIVSISGCATGPSYQKVEMIPEGKSIAYFYRPERFYGSAASPSIFDNGRLILNGLHNGGYWFYYVSPGKHVFSTKAAILEGTSVTINSAQAGEEYFIRMDILAGAFVSDAKLYRVYPEQGREEIVTCKLVE